MFAAHDVVHHFSEDPTIRRFVPHVPPSNPTQAAAVWAIGDEHAPLYWFPRDCPRVAVWPRSGDDVEAFRTAFTTLASRVHAIEAAWLARMRTASLYRYTFDTTDFEPWSEASGQWISERAVEPIGMEPVGDLLDLHAASGIELRIVPSLWPIHDLAVSDSWDFSIVRMRNALPRS